MRRGSRDTIRRSPDYERDPDWGGGNLFPAKKKPVKKNPVAIDHQETFIEETDDERERDI